jgi:hypothetical protein
MQSSRHGPPGPHQIPGVPLARPHGLPAGGVPVPPAPGDRLQAVPRPGPKGSRTRTASTGRAGRRSPAPRCPRSRGGRRRSRASGGRRAPWGDGTGRVPQGCYEELSVVTTWSQTLADCPGRDSMWTSFIDRKWPSSWTGPDMVDGAGRGRREFKSRSGHARFASFVVSLEQLFDVSNVFRAQPH